MKLEEISIKLDEEIEQAKLKKEKAQKELEQAQLNLEDLQKELSKALINEDVKVNNELLTKKTMLEERIKFYTNFLDNFNKTSLIDKDKANDYKSKIDVCLKDAMDKKYPVIIKQFKELKSNVEEISNLYAMAIEQANKIAMLTRDANHSVYTTEENKVINDLERELIQLSIRRNI